MKRWVVLATVVLLGGVFVVPARAATHGVSIKNFAFTPKDQPVTSGDTVTWTNNESDPTTNHRVVADDGSFDSGVLAPTQSFTSPAITKPVSYMCTIHPSMTGQISFPTTTTTTTTRPASTTTTLKPTTTSSSLKPTTTSSSSTSSSSTSSTEPDTTTSEDSTTTSTTDGVAAGTSKHKSGGAGAAAALIVLILVVAGAGGFAVYRLRATR